MNCSFSGARGECSAVTEALKGMRCAASELRNDTQVWKLATRPVNTTLVYPNSLGNSTKSEEATSDLPVIETAVTMNTPKNVRFCDTRSQGTNPLFPLRTSLPKPSKSHIDWRILIRVAPMFSGTSDYPGCSFTRVIESNYLGGKATCCSSSIGVH